MKYLKHFEEKKENPKIGDYVICKERHNNNPDMKGITDFISNNIGEIVFGSYNADDGEHYDYKIKYNNIPTNLIFGFNEYYERPMYRSEIIEWSENKEDLKQIITAKKYNL